MARRQEVPRRLLDRDNQRELRRQTRLLDRLERQFRGRIAREIAGATNEMVAVYRLTSEVPPASGHYERMTAIYEDMAVASVTTFAARIADQGKSSGLILETKDFADTMRQRALRYVENEAVRRRITSVTETTRSQVVAAVSRGYEDGLGIEQIAAKIIERVSEFSGARAALIARTETHGAANFGALDAAKETGLPLSKEWIAASDERTRQSHADADGQIVPIDSAFQVGSESLMFPGDPDGDPAETINCRCSVGYIVQD